MQPVIVNVADNLHSNLHRVQSREILPDVTAVLSEEMKQLQSVIGFNKILTCCYVSCQKLLNNISKIKVHVSTFTTPGTNQGHIHRGGVEANCFHFEPKCLAKFEQTRMITYRMCIDIIHMICVRMICNYFEDLCSRCSDNILHY